MNTSYAIKKRNSIRSFIDTQVDQKIILEILQCAKQCGSFVNAQPWEFAVLGGTVMKEWKEKLWNMHISGTSEEREYSIGPMPMKEPYASRANAFRNLIDNLMFPPGIDNRQQRKEDYVKSGIIVRDAPNAIIIHMDKEMASSPLHVLAAGGVTQAIALAALDKGLGTCIMGRPVESPRLIRKLTGIPQSNLILCCVAIGYIDENAKINNLRPPRAPIEELTTWHGFS